MDVVTPEYSLYEDDVDSVVETVSDADDMQESTSELGDTYIGAEVLLPVGGQQQTGQWNTGSIDMIETFLVKHTTTQFWT